MTCPKAKEPAVTAKPQPILCGRCRRPAGCPESQARVLGWRQSRRLEGGALTARWNCPDCRQACKEGGQRG